MRLTRQRYRAPGRRRFGSRYVPGIHVFGQRVKKELAEDNRRVYSNVLGAVWRRLRDGEQ